MLTSVAGRTMVGGLIFLLSVSSLPGEEDPYEYALPDVEVFGYLILFSQLFDFIAVLVLFLEFSEIRKGHVSSLERGSC